MNGIGFGWDSRVVEVEDSMGSFDKSSVYWMIEGAVYNLRVVISNKLLGIFIFVRDWVN